MTPLRDQEIPQFERALWHYKITNELNANMAVASRSSTPTQMATLKGNSDGKRAVDKKSMDILGNRHIHNTTGRRTLHVGRRDSKQIDKYNCDADSGCRLLHAGCDQSNLRHQIPSLAQVYDASRQAWPSHFTVRARITRKSLAEQPFPRGIPRLPACPVFANCAIVGSCEWCLPGCLVYQSEGLFSKIHGHS